ncbi:hypothetical protein ACIBEJ_33610 [Nonomuraea sp. NPDC050790]|uniref:hypothetical protein n=1 Tax=Nonomuraea sp. NPDC050790 TaxID=3364371 RepID=UPI0037B548E4
MAAAWLPWCQTKKHWATPSVPADAERRRETADETRATTTIHRLLSRRDIPLREQTLWRMLYEIAARAAEILALNVEDPPRRRPKSRCSSSWARPATRTPAPPSLRQTRR